MTTGLVTRLFVHDEFERLPIAETLEVFDELVHGQLHPACGVVGAVGREQHVLHAIERMIGRQRLGLKDVERRAANERLVERGDQGSLDHHGATAHIDEHGGGLHEMELPVAEHALAFPA